MRNEQKMKTKENETKKKWKWDDEKWARGREQEGVSVEKKHQENKLDEETRIVHWIQRTISRS